MNKVFSNRTSVLHIWCIVILIIVVICGDVLGSKIGIFTCLWQATIEGSRFRIPKNLEEEQALVAATTPKATQYNTKWALKVFRD